jgi:CheY-like chemotaxis protein
MASAHTLLTATRWRGAAIQHIVAAELSSQSPGQTRWEGPDITLTPRAANALALAVHELTANAVKFGALSTDAGHVEVRWRRRPEGGFVLEWVESGGPLVRTPTREGFGSTLLDKVTGRELGGSAKVEYLATGVRARLTADETAVMPSEEPVAPARPKTEPTVGGASTGDEALDRAKKVAGLKILIVEDALLLALELENRLTEAGAKVIGQAADVAEGLSMLDLPIDAAVLDANLNGQSVAPVAEALQRKGVPFIFATGYGDNQAAPQGFNAPFIRKPYDVTQVAAALAEVTGRA